MRKPCPMCKGKRQLPVCTECREPIDLTDGSCGCNAPPKLAGKTQTCPRCDGAGYVDALEPSEDELEDEDVDDDDDAEFDGDMCPDCGALWEDCVCEDEDDDDDEDLDDEGDDEDEDEDDEDEEGD